MQLQARFWYRQHRFEEARSETLRAVDALQTLGAAKSVKEVMAFLGRLDRDVQEIDGLVASHELDHNGEPPETAPLVMHIDSWC